ncbi:type II toxin-antitoxin system RelE/ParE family toxin, partial [Vibrio vulnificus]|nr:type II toxin-antitoxin system RelE/ParE family toxin [Vibrio vulnificus]
YRKFPQGSHVIFYRQIGSQNIEIIRILHKSMDVNPIFGA